jgi:hypothetical protein
MASRPTSVPDSYDGREQAWIKHQLLESYLDKLLHIIGAASKRNQQVEICYVDCFAGPGVTRPRKCRERPLPSRCTPWPVASKSSESWACRHACALCISNLSAKEQMALANADYGLARLLPNVPSHCRHASQPRSRHIALAGGRGSRFTQ